MTDKPPPKRRFWQIHLSTLLVAVLLAGWMIHLNIRLRGGSCSFYETQSGNVGPGIEYEDNCAERDEGFFGWPLFMGIRSEPIPEGIKYVPTTARENDWFKGNTLYINLLACSLIVLGAVIVLEYLIRRRVKP